MICIAKYRLLRDRDNSTMWFVHSEEESSCPICSSPELKVIGTRKRSALRGDDGKITLVIRRLRCRNCWKIHHELPDLLVPYKRYCSAVIEAVLDQDDPAVCCENSTISRIRNWFTTISEYMAGCLRGVAARLGLQTELGGGPPSQQIKGLVGAAVGWLARAVRTMANTHNWVHTRSAFMTG